MEKSSGRKLCPKDAFVYVILLREKKGVSALMTKSHQSMASSWALLFVVVVI